MEFDRSKKYFKVTNENEIHNGYQFNDGLNVDTQPWQNDTLCSAGGIYFSNAADLICYHLRYSNMTGYWIREVTVPEEETLIFAENDKFKAHSVVLGPRMKLSDETTITYLIDIATQNLRDTVFDSVAVIKNVYRFTIYAHLGRIDDMKNMVDDVIECKLRAMLFHAAYYASARGDVDMLKFLINTQLLDSYDNIKFETIFLTAVYFDHTDLIKYLLDNYYIRPITLGLAINISKNNKNDEIVDIISNYMTIGINRIEPNRDPRLGF